MDERDLLHRIETIRAARSDGRQKPHKFFLLLLALAWIQQGRGRLVHYERDVRGPLGRLLREFGPPTGYVSPQFPFWHLRTDGLWEIPDDDLARIRGGLGARGWSASPTDAALVDQDVQGGFPESAHRLLVRRPELVRRTAQAILNAHFPATLHTAICDAAGLSLSGAAGAQSQPTTDTTFRRAVLAAYERRCAVCSLDLCIDNAPLGLDAAHIRWHTASGPDTVSNGLALCSLHHHTFDRGAIGLEPQGRDDFRIVVSTTVRARHKDSRSFSRLQRRHGQALLRPSRSDQTPHPDFVGWHRRQVFRDGDDHAE